MSSAIPLNMPGRAMPPYPNGPLLDELERQLMSTQPSRRWSRGSASQQRPGAMRIVKPNSTSNSPRSSMPGSRRRTLMSDGAATLQRQLVAESNGLPSPGVEFLDPTKRTSRPVSWHPSSSYYQQLYPYQQLPRQQHLEQLAPHTNMPTPPIHQLPYHMAPAMTSQFNDYDLYPVYPHFSPVPAAYSCNTSPVSLSPLALPGADFNTYPPASDDQWNFPHQPHVHSQEPAPPSYVSPISDGGFAGYADVFPPFPAAGASHMSLGANEWDNFVMCGFDATTPPTPESVPHEHQARPTVSVTDDVMETNQLRPQSEGVEDEGEILVGMGLYDAPEKGEQDFTLGGFHPAMNALTAPPPAEANQEPMGKGLKLEETWSPPEVDEEDDDEADGAGEDEEEGEEEGKEA